MAPDPIPPYPITSYGAPAGPPKSDDTMAWAGVASGGLAWLTCCCTPVPFVGMLMNLGGLLLAVVGVVCGILAYRTARASGGRTDLPLLGIVLGTLRLVLTLGLIALAIVLVGTVGFAEYYRQVSGH